MGNFSKFMVRLSIFYIAFYFLYCYAEVILENEIYFNDFYIVLLELCLCLFVCVQGRYHCRYARYTAFGIFASDSITRLDGCFDFIPVGYAAEIPAAILAICTTTSFVLAVNHFVNVVKLNKRRNGIHQINRRRKTEA